MSEKIDELRKLVEEYNKEFPDDRLEPLIVTSTIEKAINIIKNRDRRRIIIEPSGELEIDGIVWKYE